MSEEKSGNSTNWAGVTKWLVLGTVIITALFLFKDELKKFIGDADEIIITGDGITMKRAKTSLGELAFSAPQSPDKAGSDNSSVRSSGQAKNGINGNTFTSERYRFSIDIPNSVEWYMNDNVSRETLNQYAVPVTSEVPVIVMHTRPISNFIPNVNVLISKAGEIKISDYAIQYEENIKRMNSGLISKNVDEASQGALFVYNSNYTGTPILQFVRIIIRDGLIYELTASGLPPLDQLNDQVKSEMASILNSFRFVT